VSEKGKVVPVHVGRAYRGNRGVNVKQPRYRPGVVQRVPGSEGSQIT